MSDDNKKPEKIKEPKFNIRVGCNNNGITSLNLYLDIPEDKAFSKEAAIKMIKDGMDDWINNF